MPELGESLSREKMLQKIKRVRKKLGLDPFEEANLDSLSDNRLIELYEKAVAELKSKKKPEKRGSAEPKAGNIGKKNIFVSNQKTLALTAGILIIVIAVLLYVFVIVPGGQTPFLDLGQSQTKPRPLLKLDRNEVLGIAKGTFPHYPELMAVSKATEKDESWLVEVKIPGWWIIHVTVSKYDKKANRVNTGDVFYEAVDSAEEAKDLVRFFMDRGNIELEASSSNGEWLIPHPASDHMFVIDKITGEMNTRRGS